MAIETAPKPQATAADEMPLHGIDHVELYVGNATQAAHWFTHALGFRCHPWHRIQCDRSR